jgi:hypothetical protein
VHAGNETAQGPVEAVGPRPLRCQGAPRVPEILAQLGSLGAEAMHLSDGGGSLATGTPQFGNEGLNRVELLGPVLGQPIEGALDCAVGEPESLSAPADDVGSDVAGLVGHRLLSRRGDLVPEE